MAIFQINAPQREKIVDLTEEGAPELAQFESQFYDSFYGSLDKSLLGRNNLKIIHNKNFFSDFWVTKDENENVRYTCAFDLASFLSQTSKFPRLYTSEEILEELLDGGQMITVDSSHDERARVVYMEAKRRLIDFSSFQCDNNLGTVVRQKQKVITNYYPEVIIESPSKLDNLKLPDYQGPDSRILFYEGFDSLEKEHHLQNISRYQYGMRFYVQDPAQLYIERSLQKLMTAERIIQKYFDTVVNTPGLYDASTKLITTQPENILIENAAGQDPLPASMVLPEQVIVFVSMLRKFKVPVKQGTLQEEIFDPYSPAAYRSVEETMRRLVLSSSPETVKQALNTISLFIHDISSIVGNLNPNSNGLEATSSKFRLGNPKTPVAQLEVENYFTQTVEVGIQNGLGYDYLGTFKRDKRKLSIGRGFTVTGPTRVPIGIFGARVRREFDKYFCPDQAPNADDGPASAPNMNQLFYADAGYRYLSPAVLRRPGKTEIDQLKYFPTSNEVNAPYNFNEYGSFFADIIKTKHATKYLTHPYYHLYDRPAKQSEPTQTAAAMLDLLNLEHSCEVKEEIDEQFTVPSPTRAPFVPVISLLGGKFSRQLIPSILGGGNLGVVALEQSQQAITDSLDQQQRLNIDQLRRRENNVALPPTKILFALLGELEVNQGAPSSISSNDQDFNSSTRMKEILNVSERNVKKLIEGPELGFLPNQLKSMLGWSASNKGLLLGEEKFDARRILLTEEDSESDMTGGQSNPFVSYWTAGSENPAYKLTRDPMKVYAKLLAFWTNYKQLGIIEYLSSFDDVSPTFGTSGNQDIVSGNKVARPMWKKMTANMADLLNQGSYGEGNLLCRVRTATNEDILQDGSLLNQVNELARNDTLSNGEPLAPDFRLLVDAPSPVIDFDISSLNLPSLTQLSPRISTSISPSMAALSSPSILRPTASPSISPRTSYTPMRDMVSPQITVNRINSVASSVRADRSIAPSSRGRLYQVHRVGDLTPAGTVDPQQQQNFQDAGARSNPRTEESQQFSDELAQKIVDNNLEFLSQKELFNLPIYHEYFYISFGYRVD